jgi:hypothetical protein
MKRTRTAAILVAAMLMGSTVRLGSAAALSVTSQRLTPYRTCTITATPAGTTGVSDANVRQAAPATNFGGTASYAVSSGTGVNQRIYIRFDLTVCSPAIGASAIVRLATLRLYVTTMSAVCRTLDLFPSTAAWTEGLITWNNEPFGTAINNPPTASRTGSFTVGTAAGCVNQNTGAYVTGATATSDVASFVAGGATNFGWMIRDDVENSATGRTESFSTKDLGTVAQAPQLVVTYVVVP